MDNHMRFRLSMTLLGIAVLGLSQIRLAGRTLYRLVKKNQIKLPFIYAGMVLLAFFLFWLCNNHLINGYNNFSYLSDALLHGRLDVPDMPDNLESVSFGGKKYMHFAPGPALLSLPFVWVFGVQGFNCALLAMALGAVNLLLAYLVLKNLQIGKNYVDRIWLSLMLVFGTVHFFCASQGSSWFLGHVSTLFWLLLSMVFLTKAFIVQKQEACIFLSGLFFGLAVTCRLSALLGAVFFVGYLFLNKKDNKSLLKMIVLFGCGAAVFGFLYMLYNFVRYGSIMDMGYNLTYLKDYHREQYELLQAAPFSEQKRLLKQYNKEFGGPLQLQFVRSNLYSIFLLRPEFQREFPYIIPTLYGVAVTYTSPMLYCGVGADWKRGSSRILGITTILTAIPFLMNYGNGMAQFGMRYSMDFTPYLWLLMCYALTRRGKVNRWARIGIAVCILIQGWGTLYWTCFYG